MTPGAQVSLFKRVSTGVQKRVNPVWAQDSLFQNGHSMASRSVTDTPIDPKNIIVLGLAVMSNTRPTSPIHSHLIAPLHLHCESSSLVLSNSNTLAEASRRCSTLEPNHKKQNQSQNSDVDRERHVGIITPTHAHSRSDSYILSD